MTPGEMSAMVGLGLVSSLHCAQMCGPIVLAYSGGSSGRNWPMHLAYNAGRILTYSFLGALAGWGGQGLSWAGRVTGAAPAATMVAGLLMILAGVLMVRPLRGNGLVAIGATSMFGFASRSSARFLLSPSIFSKFAMGLALGLLPCGLVYAALAKAFSTGSPWDGALTVAGFGVGTAASLVAIGSFAAPLLGWLRTRGAAAWPDRLASASLVIFGAVMIWRALAAPETLFAEGVNGIHCH